MTSRGQRQQPAYLLSPLTGPTPRKPELPLSPSLTSVTPFILSESRIGKPKLVFFRSLLELRRQRQPRAHAAGG
jgi:hypothetical protein